MVVAALVTAVPEAYGQNATPAARQSANPSSPAAGTQAAADAQTATGTQAASRQATAGGQGTQAATGASQAGGAAQGNGGAAAGSPQPNGADKAGKPSTVCFQLTGRCVEPAKAPTTKGGTASASKDGTSAKRPLNLTAPDVRTVVSADELKEPLPSDTQITEVQEADTVSVKGNPDAPDVPGGFGALWWALNHPSQAWRILAPAE
jgi:hypothetical protein